MHIFKYKFCLFLSISYVCTLRYEPIYPHFCLPSLLMPSNISPFQFHIFWEGCVLNTCAHQACSEYPPVQALFRAGDAGWSQSGGTSWVLWCSGTDSVQQQVLTDENGVDLERWRSHHPSGQDLSNSGRSHYFTLFYFTYPSTLLSEQLPCPVSLPEGHRVPKVQVNVYCFPTLYFLTASWVYWSRGLFS